MSGANIDPGSTAPGIIHHATVFGRAGYSAATACGRTEQPKPATDDWRDVSCPACLKAAPPRKGDTHHFNVENVPVCGLRSWRRISYGATPTCRRCCGILLAALNESRAPDATPQGKEPTP